MDAFRAQEERLAKESFAQNGINLRKTIKNNGEQIPDVDIDGTRFIPQVASYKLHKHNCQNINWSKTLKT